MVKPGVGCSSRWSTRSTPHRGSFFGQSARRTGQRATRLHRTTNQHLNNMSTGGFKTSKHYLPGKHYEAIVVASISSSTRSCTSHRRVPLKQCTSIGVPVECMTHLQPCTPIPNSKNAMNVKRQWRSKLLPSSKSTLLRDVTSFTWMAQPNTTPRRAGRGVLDSGHQGHWVFSSPVDTLEKQTNNGRS